MTSADARPEGSNAELAEVRSVLVAVATLRRPNPLRRMLRLVLSQADQVEAARPGLRVNVLVVDNDPQGSAALVVAGVAATRGSGGAALTTVVEPRPGVSAVRNRAVEEAVGYDLLVFIDDDEVPSEEWLARLLDTRAATGADAVAGAVVTDFPPDTDPWILAGGFLDRRHRTGLRTGTSIEVAATNNLLLDLRTVRRLGLRFDERFGASGGEDTLFTRRLVIGGGRMIWCAEAVVHDTIATSRLDRRWMLRRVFAFGVTDSRVAAALSATRASAARARSGAAIGGIARLPAGAVLWAYGRAAGSVRSRARGAQLLARGSGRLAGAVGYVPREYAGRSRADGVSR